MSLTLNALPDPRNQFESLQRALREKNDQLAEKQERIEALENKLREEAQRNRMLEIGAKELRATLTPLFSALQLVFGYMDDMRVTADATPHHPAKQAVWESWKQKLGGLTAKAIDALLLHGPMNQTQLRIQLACASRSVTNLVGALNKAGLINKVDGKISLKEI